MNIHQELKYTKEHEWVKIEGNRVTVGVTDYAQEQLGDIVFVELPDVDDEIGTGDSFAVLESVKAAADVYSPLTGVVAEINEDLLDEPALVNSEPYGNGWMVVFEVEDVEAIEGLMTPEEYSQFVAEQE
ncbi:MAG: glycine cleavage system protein GcvH [Firmicutes bacterium]|nr:glycine cleavage system protein GcvH [Bacillota bacterium]